jgi:hypothetical protein
MGQTNDPRPGEPQDTDKKPISTGTTASEETGADIDDAKKAGMRPSGSGGSAPPDQSR